MTTNETQLIAALQESFQQLVHNQPDITLSVELTQQLGQVLGMLDSHRLAWCWEWFDITKNAGPDVRCLANLISYCQVMGSVGFTAADGDIANTMPNILLTAATAPGGAHLFQAEVADLAEAVNPADATSVLILALGLVGTTRKSAQQQTDLGLKALLGDLVPTPNPGEEP